MDLTTRKVEIAAENHGFAVDMESVKDHVVMTHMNLNDKTCEASSTRPCRPFPFSTTPSRRRAARQQVPVPAVRGYDGETQELDTVTWRKSKDAMKIYS